MQTNVEKGGTRKNDPQSKRPGLTVYVTHEGHLKAIQTCLQEGYPIKGNQVKIFMTNRVTLRLPEGVYSDAMCGIQFWQKTTARDWEQQHIAQFPFPLNYNQVVRIEGDSDEIWQNSTLKLEAPE